MKTTKITITIESDVQPIININDNKVSTSTKKEVKPKRVKLTDEQKKEKAKEYARTYFQNNKVKIYDRIRSYQATYHRERRHNDPIFAWAHNRRIEIHTMLNAKDETRFYTWPNCTVKQLREHLESTFTGDMGWHNLGLVYEIDHIIPLSSVVSLDDMMKAADYKNLRVVTVKENRYKHAKTN